MIDCRAMEPKPCYVYVVRCRDGSLYVGICRGLKARINRHNAGRGAKYTRSRRPVRLAYYERCGARREAVLREAELKKWPKLRKEQLVRGVVGEEVAEARRESGR